jgi:hypothetical protein
MDMKKILQALDGTAVKPVEGANDMKQFMSIINEGANPHKVSLPVQMAMQHYSTPVIKEQPKPSLLKQYFAEAEETLQQAKAVEKKKLNQFARTIAERVQMKESAIPGHSAGFTGGVGPGAQSNLPMEDIDNPKDIVKMDIPLLIRLLEYAREDAKTDMDLHNVTEKLIDFSKQGDVLTMDQYDAIVGEQKLLPNPTNESCWNGYKQVGMKKKGAKNVPNCVPKGK